MTSNKFDIESKGLEYIPAKKQKMPENLNKVIVPIKPGLALSVTELMDVVDFIAALANAIGGFLLGGGNIFKAAVLFIPVVPKLVNAIVGLNKIPSELNSLTGKQKNDIIDAVKAELTFSEQTEEVIGVALDIAFKIKSLISIF